MEFVRINNEKVITLLESVTEWERDSQTKLTLYKEFHPSRYVSRCQVRVFVVGAEGAGSWVDTSVETGGVDMRSRHESIDEARMAIREHTKTWYNRLSLIFPVV